MSKTFPRQWLEMIHPETKEVWNLDITFLLSTYNCIFGQGCPGAWGEEDHSGCCATTPWFSEDEDPESLRKYVERLTPEHTDNYKEIQERWYVKYPGKDNKARTVGKDKYCIFFNKGKADGTTGCALHAEALRQGEDYLDWKPYICGVIPFKIGFEPFGIAITVWDRDDDGGWGPTAEGRENGWWCTEEDAAYQHEKNVPVFVTFKNELIRMMGREMYDEMYNVLKPLYLQKKESKYMGRVANTYPVTFKKKGGDK
jgi:Fe-S-cluster containining protein